MKCTGFHRVPANISAHAAMLVTLTGLTAPVSQDLDGHIALCEAKMVRDGVVNIIIISTSYSKHHPHIFYDQTNHNRGDSGGYRGNININIVFTMTRTEELMPKATKHFTIICLLTGARDKREKSTEI